MHSNTSIKNQRYIYTAFKFMNSDIWTW